MTWEDLLAYCLTKPGAGRTTLGGRRGGQGRRQDLRVPRVRRGPFWGLKCGSSREAADEWLLRYPDDVSAMAYIGRSGWNTLRIGGAIGDDELLEAIDASYSAIVSKLPNKDRPPGIT